MGDQYFKDFSAIFPKLAKEQNMTLVPFLLDKVAGIQNLNQADGVHPTKEGQHILAENVWAHLEAVL
jgi:acyl-CoA thioesterase-1